MMGKLGVVVFLYYLHIELCKAETISRNGFCVVHYNEETSVVESYIHEYTRSQLQLCYSHGYYNCWRDVKKTETRTRIVPKSIARTRIECCAGYENTTVHENVFSCEPVCDPPCIEGHCSTPGNCTCFHGFEHEHSNKCVPVCKPSCVNAICDSPGHCECMQGYKMVNSSYCEPHCSHKCINGICHKPEECLCNAGFKENSDYPFECDPICETACINATCSSYNECTCWIGFGKIPGQDNACKPLCELECLNSDCTAPNTCTCRDGYYKNDSLNICEPYCANCSNGICMEPNICICNENYTSNDQGSCDPVCNDCNNGMCIAPDECVCHEGYQLDNDGKCSPYCDNCENGECIEPDVCRCFDGYQNLFGNCYPVCEYGCFSGECVAPNNCSCRELDRVEDNVCFPLQQNTSNISESISPKRFQVDIMKIANSIDEYDLHLSMIYIKINCSFETSHNTRRSSERNNLNSIECTNIKNAFGLYAFCIWNDLSLAIQDLYSELFYSDIQEFNETESEKYYTKLGLTALLPEEMMSEEEGCYLCPYSNYMRARMPSNFSITLAPCELKPLQSVETRFNWKIIGFTGLSILVAALLVILGLMFFKKHFTHDYLVRSSEKTDQIALSLNHEEY